MTDKPPFGLTEALERNIEALAERRRNERAHASLQERVADRITRFTGSMAFVYVHLAIVGLWVAVNVGAVPGVTRFDPTFVILATAASVEAIFLSTFVLISQNRMQADADRRADLDLHISLLTEHELTKLAGVVAAIAEKVGVDAHRAEDVQEIETDIDPERVLDEIEAQKS
ncbi:DUF1003 domain-containing protein [Sphingomonas sp.]|jgi:uncharacterized membrane protein|uniref:DUF1003 domain-containing protein n=1 Tax=Sphingomonas sp. TaxID=28214 RepID=UPI002DF4244A|nr:DUF1003 domain-containing protein [Sphingomonas sp.]